VLTGCNVGRVLQAAGAVTPGLQRVQDAVSVTSVSARGQPVNCSGSVAREKRRTVLRPMPSCRAMDRLRWPAASSAWTVACLARVRSANRWPVGQGYNPVPSGAAAAPPVVTVRAADKRGAGRHTSLQLRRGCARGATCRRPGELAGRRWGAPSA